jgi:hypothetical protein
MEPLPSGKFVLRIEPGLHAALRAAAEVAGLSLNEYCARKLAAPGAGPGEAVEGSDLDVLVVVDGQVELRRALYHEWDAAPLWWEGHRVEAHFVHLPEAGRRLTALWAEAAVDGVVLYDPVLEVSRRLATFRDRIASGELVRRRVHGQPYWVEAA